MSNEQVPPVRDHERHVASHAERPYGFGWYPGLPATASFWTLEGRVSRMAGSEARCSLDLAYAQLAAGACRTDRSTWSGQTRTLRLHRDLEPSVVARRSSRSTGIVSVRNVSSTSMAGERAELRGLLGLDRPPGDGGEQP
jgi:hypothetical protein